MKIRLLALVGLAISFAVPAFVQQKDTASDQQATQKIRALDITNTGSPHTKT